MQWKRQPRDAADYNMNRHETNASERIGRAVAQALRGLRRERPSVVAALSGGPDSVALLLALRESGAADLRAAHCNFHLRGEASDSDALFVERLCARLDVPLSRIDFDVEGYMRTHKGVSLEMACRELRYEWFFRLLADTGSDRLATGHNADDNAETMLLNMLRGAGSRGLGGMDADNGRVLRPLLAVSRREILEYLAAKGQDYVTDATNLESDYRRNFLRNEIMPLLRSRWPGADKALATTADNLRREAAIVDAAVVSALSSFGSQPGRLLTFPAINGFADPHTLLHRFLDNTGFSGPLILDISMALADTRRSGRTWSSATHILEERADGLHLRETTIEENDASAIFEWEAVEMRPGLLEEIRAERGNSVFWTSESPDSYKLRHYREGDRMQPLGMKGSRKLSDIMKDGGVTPSRRPEVWVAEYKESGEVEWAEGLRRSRHHLVNAAYPLAYRLRRRQ